MVEALADTPVADKQDVVWYIKNPTSPDIDLWCGAVERLKRAGYSGLCAIHRGFALGEHTTTIYRNAPLWSVAIEFKRRYPDVPLLTDASHIAGQAERVPEVAEQAIRMGMDGLMIEVHSNPAQALSDARQQLTPEDFAQLLHRLTPIDSSSAGTESAELASLRQQIDETDDELWALISKRMDISRRIGEYKREHGIPVLQSARYDELLQRRMLWAEKHGIDPGAAKQIMDIIHEQSVLRQV
jgi:chorismate mutase